MKPLTRAFLLLKELGPGQLADNLLYRLQLYTGWLEAWTPAKKISCKCQYSFPELFSFDWVGSRTITKPYIQLAEEIVSGKFHPFGSKPVNLDLTLPQPLRHWTKYGDTLNGKDIKEFWEPSRFSWCIPLIIAYTATKDERYPEAFWKYFDIYRINNPVNLGPNWSSAQEVALRLIPWVMAGQVLSKSKTSTTERMDALALAMQDHCRRIPVSLHYARSQHNNHILSEALGLMIGGLVFKETRFGSLWLASGNREFQKGILDLVEMDGTFSQHSTIYHRMLLHLSLLYLRVVEEAGLNIPNPVHARLAAATKWLWGQFDLISGQAANLGHNDGSNILAIGCVDYSDQRPTLQAAYLAFLGQPCMAEGAWNELSKCLKIPTPNGEKISANGLVSTATHRLNNGATWASLRACTFYSRPAHADLLHVDIWSKGENIALDAGTYAYNLLQPWENALAQTLVHNTVSINNENQMIRAGKFLWLNRVDAQIVTESSDKITARIQVKSKQPYAQTRTLTMHSEKDLEVVDDLHLYSSSNNETKAIIQWLLPDWDWQLQNDALLLKHGRRSIRLKVIASANDTALLPSEVSLVRAGECLAGRGVHPIRGWISSTYLEKYPALSYAVQYRLEQSIQIKTLWQIDQN